MRPGRTVLPGCTGFHRAGKGTPGRQRRRQQQGRQCPGRGPGPVGDAAYPLPQAALAAGQGGGGHQQRGRAGAAHGQQGAAVGHPFLRGQTAQRRFVAGQFPVLPGGRRCPPDQRVEPVQRQTYPPQRRPQVIPVAQVGQFMGQHMADHRRVGRRGFGQVDGRAQQPRQTGGLHRAAHIHRHPAAHRQPSAAAAQPGVKPQAGSPQRRQHHRRAGQPDQRQQRLPCQRPLHLLVLPVGGRAGKDQFRPAVRAGAVALHRAVFAPFHPVHRLHQFGGPGGGGALHRVEQAHRALAQVHRQQQAQQYQPPHRVPNPGPQPVFQYKPQQPHDQDQSGAADRPVKGHCPPPPFPPAAISRTARRSPGGSAPVFGSARSPAGSRCPCTPGPESSPPPAAPRPPGAPPG